MVSILGVILSLLLVYLALEYYRLRVCVKKIPQRILVNGTRGKSTTTRILYQIFLISGKRPVARTTGDAVQEYYPDGSSQHRHRMAPANIIENVRFIIKWAKKEPDVMILECMVIEPELQAVLTRIFQPTHIIFTNFLPDHFESMGNDINKIRRAMLLGIHTHAQIILPEREKANLDEMDRNSKSILCFNAQAFKRRPQNIPAEIIEDSWGLIFRICQCFELSTSVAENVFRQVWDSISNSIVLRNSDLGYEMVNLFSVNDPETARLFLNFWHNSGSPTDGSMIILNARADRPLRTLRFLNLVKELLPDSSVCFAGDGKYFALFHARRMKLGQSLSAISWAHLEKLIQSKFDIPLRLFCLANHKGAERFIKLSRIRANK